MFHTKMLGSQVLLDIFVPCLALEVSRQLPQIIIRHPAEKGGLGEVTGREVITLWLEIIDEQVQAWGLVLCLSLEWSRIQTSSLRWGPENIPPILIKDTPKIPTSHMRKVRHRDRKCILFWFALFPSHTGSITSVYCFPGALRAPQWAQHLSWEVLVALCVNSCFPS